MRFGADRTRLSQLVAADMKYFGSRVAVPFVAGCTMLVSAVALLFSVFFYISEPPTQQNLTYLYLSSLMLALIIVCYIVYRIRSARNGVQFGSVMLFSAMCYLVCGISGLALMRTCWMWRMITISQGQYHQYISSVCSYSVILPLAFAAIFALIVFTDTGHNLPYTGWVYRLYIFIPVSVMLFVTLGTRFSKESTAFSVATRSSIIYLSLILTCALNFVFKYIIYRYLQSTPSRYETFIKVKHAKPAVSRSAHSAALSPFEQKPIETVKPAPVVELKPEPIEEDRPEPAIEAKPSPIEKVEPMPVAEIAPEPIEEIKPEPAAEQTPEPIAHIKPAPATEFEQTDDDLVVETKRTRIVGGEEDDDYVPLSERIAAFGARVKALFAKDKPEQAPSDENEPEKDADKRVYHYEPKLQEAPSEEEKSGEQPTEAEKPKEAAEVEQTVEVESEETAEEPKAEEPKRDDAEATEPQNDMPPSQEITAQEAERTEESGLEAPKRRSRFAQWLKSLKAADEQPEAQTEAPSDEKVSLEAETQTSPAEDLTRTVIIKLPDDIRMADTEPLPPTLAQRVRNGISKLLEAREHPEQAERTQETTGAEKRVYHYSKPEKPTEESKDGKRSSEPTEVPASETVEPKLAPDEESRRDEQATENTVEVEPTVETQSEEQPPEKPEADNPEKETSEAAEPQNDTPPTDESSAQQAELTKKDEDPDEENEAPVRRSLKEWCAHFIGSAVPTREPQADEASGQSASAEAATETPDVQSEPPERRSRLAKWLDKLAAASEKPAQQQEQPQGESVPLDVEPQSPPAEDLTRTVIIKLPDDIRAADTEPLPPTLAQRVRNGIDKLREARGQSEQTQETQSAEKRVYHYSKPDAATEESDNGQVAEKSVEATANEAVLPPENPTEAPQDAQAESEDKSKPLQRVKAWLSRFMNQAATAEDITLDVADANEDAVSSDVEEIVSELIDEPREESPQPMSEEAAQEEPAKDADVPEQKQRESEPDTASIAKTQTQPKATPPKRTVETLEEIRARLGALESKTPDAPKAYSKIEVKPVNAEPDIVEQLEEPQQTESEPAPEQTEPELTDVMDEGFSKHEPMKPKHKRD